MCAEFYLACLLRCGALAGNIKVDFCRSFKVASTTAAAACRVPACVNMCALTAGLSLSESSSGVRCEVAGAPNPF